MPRPSRPTSRTAAGARGAAVRPDRRLRLWVLAVMLVLALLCARLVQLQGADASALAARALAQRTSQLTLHAERGEVLDARGVVLATSVERRTVVADPSIIASFNTRADGSPRDEDLPQGPAGAARLLAPVLGVDEETLTGKLTGEGRYAVLARGLTPETWQRVVALDVSGIASERTTQRIYPAGDAASTLVGVLGRDGQALSGLEMADDELLTGTDGSMRYERSLQGQQIPLGESETTEAVDGHSLHLTIDRDLQWKAQTAIAAKVEETGARSGTVVVMDRQQRLLALASAPSIDPSNLTGFTNTQLNNTALTEAFEPGSTAKVVTMAAVLEEGVETPASRFVVPDEIERADKVFHDSHSHEDENLTLAGVLATSSNTGTIMAGEKLDAGTLYDYQRAFGFGSRTALEFPGETAGIVAPPEEYSGSQRFTVMFGQGLSVNAVQAASVFATIANDGVRVEPSLVSGTSSPDGDYTPSPAPASSRVVSSGTATTLRQMMEAVVEEGGTAQAANIPGYLVAGKTGTAQRYDDEVGRYNGYTASFIGMAPADDPQLVVAVILQDPRTSYYGGSTAGPVFKDVMTYALRQRGVPPSASEPARLPLEWGVAP
ncbi:peptidoglycan D,D-transpeptidase FtsI family protein [Kineococcus terrestris]|uniref:peptidoglycan D,D-transpeptidase FtsI family protein n=1 Tax=Kineococcus terrestris TaxID=2044856 RepID=UPI0034DB45A5